MLSTRNRECFTHLLLHTLLFKNFSSDNFLRCIQRSYVVMNVANKALVKQT